MFAPAPRGPPSATLPAWAGAGVDAPSSTDRHWAPPPLNPPTPRAMNLSGAAQPPPGPPTVVVLAAGTIVVLLFVASADDAPPSAVRAGVLDPPAHTPDGAEDGDGGREGAARPPPCGAGGGHRGGKGRLAFTTDGKEGCWQGGMGAVTGALG